MRSVVVGIAVAWVACGPASSSAPPAVAPIGNVTATPMSGAMIENTSAPCRDAAVGLERATRDVRKPGSSVLDIMLARCRDDGWLGDAVNCFATMTPDDLATCVGKLAKAQRDAMLGALVSNSEDPRAAVEVAEIRLAGVKVGVAECDQFVAAVAGLMRCESMPIATRVDLGDATVDLWSVPNHGLPADAARRLAAVCGTSLASLQQQAATAGCASQPAP